MILALDVTGLRLCINDKLILDNITFSIEKGCWYTIIGHNGSGKTSLLRCLMHLHHHCNGKISVVDNCIETLSQLKLAQLISYVPQKAPANLEMNVKDFLMLSRYPYHRCKNSQKDKDAINKAIMAMEIEKFVDRGFHTLSGGEQQRVMIAAALAQQTPIILMDEPGAFLDPSMRYRILQRLRKISKEENSTVIEVSHDLNTTLRVADHFIALSNGTICASGAISSLTSVETLETIFQEKFQIIKDLQGYTAVLPL